MTGAWTKIASEWINQCASRNEIAASTRGPEGQCD